MPEQQQNSGLDRPDLMPAASGFWNEQERNKLFAAMMVAGVIFRKNESARAWIDSATGLVYPSEGEAAMNYTRAPGDPFGPAAKPKGYESVDFFALDRGQRLSWTEDSDEYAAFDDANDPGGFDRRKAIQGLGLVATATSLVVNSLLGASATPSVYADRAAAGVWTTATNNPVVDIDAAIANADGREFNAAYMDERTWRAFRTNPNVWDTFGGNVGFGRLTEANARQALSDIAGVDPSKIYVTKKRVGVNAGTIGAMPYFILLNRGDGPAPDFTLPTNPCGVLMHVSTRRALAGAGVMEEPAGAGESMLAPFLAGVRITSKAIGHVGQEIYTRLKMDAKINRYELVRVSGTYTP